MRISSTKRLPETGRNAGRVAQRRKKGKAGRTMLVILLAENVMYQTYIMCIYIYYVYSVCLCMYIYIYMHMDVCVCLLVPVYIVSPSIHQNVNDA